MYDGSEGNAMTEVALALAMGFFSILVLALVSMGAGSGVASSERDTATTLLSLVVSETSAQPVAQLNSDDQIVIVHRGALLDAELKPLEPRNLDAAKRVVLAIDPTAPIDQALEAFNQVGRPDAVVAALDQRWRETLSQLDQGARP
ncbi:MAG: hypothetical protein AAF495_14650 [Pseudomonadota bacterium]